MIKDVHFNFNKVIGYKIMILIEGVAVMNPGWKQPDNLHPIQHEL